MSYCFRRIGLVVVALCLTGSPARAQFWGGGFWDMMGGGQTPQGAFAQGMGMYALGAGRYNLETAKAASIDADTAMRWNQYIWEARRESARIYHEKLARDRERGLANSEAIRLRLRNNPNAGDIARGDALNVVLEELNNPKVFSKAVDYGGKVKVGGAMIREIPFQYASAAITTSVRQLVDGPPPAPLRREEFAADVAKIKAIAAELRGENEELGAHKPETLQKAKDHIMAMKAKVEATFPRTSQDFRDANRYLRALNGLVSMLETPAVNVLLAGVENRPEATLGDLIQFMAVYNLRFGASSTTRQREVYMTLYPMLVKLRDDVAPPPETATAASAPVNLETTEAVFDGVGYNSTEGKGARSPR